MAPWSSRTALAKPVKPKSQQEVPPARPPSAPRPDVGLTVERPTLVWNDDWPKFHAWEAYATAAFAAASVGALFIPVGQGRWTSVNGLDQEARSALRVDNRQSRIQAGFVSDGLLTLGVNYMLFDALVVAWWFHGRGSVALQMTLIDMETVAFTVGATSLVKGVSARERPYAEECRADPRIGRTDDCTGKDRYRSFFSGHTSTAFAVAGATCMHHAHLPLYGGGLPDALACVGALGVAGATGTMRIVSDEHYATDVAGGAAFGTLAGLGLPWLLHYRGGARARDGRDAVSVRVVPFLYGAGAVGRF